VQLLSFCSDVNFDVGIPAETMIDFDLCIFFPFLGGE